MTLKEKIDGYKTSVNSYKAKKTCDGCGLKPGGTAKVFIEVDYLRGNDELIGTYCEICRKEAGMWV